MLHDVHKRARKCWPTLALLDKYHHITHTVQEMKEKAPPYIAWCMDFERQHQKLKEDGPTMNNKSTCETYMERAAWKLAFMVRYAWCRVCMYVADMCMWLAFA